MAERYDYKVIELREKFVGGKISAEKMENVLNEQAAHGWRLKTLTRAGGEVNSLRMWFTFEREVG